MIPAITPIRSWKDRVTRQAYFFDTGGLPSREQFYPSILLAYFDGLDRVAGENILEIGGTKEQNMGIWAVNQGNRYHCITFEPWVDVRPDDPQSKVDGGDFMWLPEHRTYSLVFAVKVFEPRGMYHTQRGDFVPPKEGYTHEQMSEQLSRLTTPGGYAVIATATKSFLSDEELTEVGFQIKFRET
ncbi:hypothetical protein HYV84_03915, partial [Candidatus Woesearchaeota archaeon]|nr:hypothetical protein [Candidatus Woesearchaeota archaeon]